jgi:elongation factor Ts
VQISATLIKELRGRTSAGVMECKNALQEAGGDLERASEILRERGLAKAEEKTDRVASQGLIEAYVHHGGRLGALVEVNCETDFVAHTDEFKALAHDLTLQVVATAPQFISAEEIPEGAKLNPEEVCLLAQPFIKDPTKKIEEIIAEVMAKVGEKISIRRFSRFELGK